MKKIAAFILFIGVLDSISAQSTLTLDSCRALALSNNKELRISAEKITAAHYEKKAAFTNYLPKIAAIGTYMHTQKEISLLSDEQKGAISQIGTEHRLPMGGDFFLHIGYEFSGYGNESCITGTGQSIPVTPLLPDLCRFGT